MATLRYMDFQSQIKGKLFQILQGHRNVQSPGRGDFFRAEAFWEVGVRKTGLEPQQNYVGRPSPH